MVVAALAVLKAGGAYVPLDPEAPPERLAFILTNAQAPVLVTKHGVAAQLPIGGWRIVDLNLHAPDIARQPTEAPTGEAKPEHLAYLIYTSGTTGQPKGVEITHASLLNLVFWHRRAFAVTAADRASRLANPAFDAAVWEVWPYLTAGASLHLPERATRVTPRRLRDWLVEQKITISFLPTVLAEAMLDLDWPTNAALRLLLTGGDTLHRYPSAKLPFTLVNNYGLTESTVVATSGPVFPERQAERLPSIGRPIANTQVYILDGRLRPVPIGTPGELYIGGAGIARGYRNLPERTAEKFILNPFRSEPGARLCKTGDLARFLPDGQIAFLGRLDDQIKIRGYRIEPNEIVAALDTHAGVRSSFVVAREIEPGGRRLVAYFVPASDSQPTHKSLRDHLRARLPGYMVPAIFVRLDSLPQTSRGKLDRAGLPAPDPQNTLRDATVTATRAHIEEQLAAILAPLLGLGHVGREDNFLLLGGQGQWLLGTRLIARLCAAFGVELTLRGLFQAPTLAKLAAEVERRLPAKREAMSEDEARHLPGSIPPQPETGNLG
jgi:amino acid adenylation domain-containing protein